MIQRRKKMTGDLNQIAKFLKINIKTGREYCRDKGLFKHRKSRSKNGITIGAFYDCNISMMVRCCVCGKKMSILSDDVIVQDNDIIFCKGCI